MSKPRRTVPQVIGCAAAGLAAVLLGGCANTPGKETAPGRQAGAQPAPPADSAWPEEELPGRTTDADIEELKRLADTYARQLEAVIAQRQMRQGAETPGEAEGSAPATQPTAQGDEAGEIGEAAWPEVLIESGETKTNTAIAVGQPLNDPAGPGALDEPPATEPTAQGTPQGTQQGKQPLAAVVSIDGDPFADLVDETVLTPAGTKLLNEITARLDADPNDVAAHLDYQLLQLAMGQSVPDLKRLSQLPSEDRQVVATIVDGLANLRREVSADRNLLMSDKIRPMTDMADRLLEQSVMTVPALRLCRRVDGFAAYQPFDPARFRQGRQHDVIVYCELDNFTSNLSPESLWETKLTKQLVLYSENGVKVWSDEKETVTDKTRSKRRDFFFAKMIRLPESLTTGRYTLKVTVVDENANQVAESSVGLEIVAE